MDLQRAGTVKPRPDAWIPDGCRPAARRIDHGISCRLPGKTACPKLDYQTIFLSRIFGFKPAYCLPVRLTRVPSKAKARSRDSEMTWHLSLYRQAYTAFGVAPRAPA